VFTVTFWEDQSLTAYDYMYKWYQLTGSSKYNEGVGKVSYIKNMAVYLKDVNDLIITGKLSFANCFPTDIASTNLNYDDSSAVETTVTFAYDYVEFGDSEENISALSDFRNRLVTLGS